VDASALTAAFQSLKIAADMAKAMANIHDANVVKEKVRELTGVIIEAQSQTLDAQTQLSDANDQIRALKQQIEKMETWAAEKQRYALAEPVVGVFVYQLKEEARGDQPIHSVCTKCYQDGTASILQSETMVTPQGFVKIMACPECDTEIVLSGMRGVKPGTSRR
jgi:hypothetical protein